MILAPRTTVLLVLAVTSAGCASEPSAETLVDEERTLERGEFLEVDVEIDAGGEVRASYSANGTVGWNVHSHEDGEVVVHDEGAGTNGTIAYQAPDQGTYSLLWQNRDADPVELSVTVRGQARVVNVAP